MTSGVPQGSVLGPLLFLIYINDLAHIPLSQGSSLYMFADDILLTKTTSPYIDLSDFQQDVNQVSNWSKLNLLSLNAEKPKFMFISRSRNRASTDFFGRVST